MFRAACSLNKTINEYLGNGLPVTHRQHEAYMEWLNLEWNEPNRTDYYLMQVAAMWSEDGDINARKLPFRFDKTKAEVMETPEQRAERIKREQNVVIGALGGDSIRRRTMEEAAAEGDKRAIAILEKLKRERGN